MLPTTGINSVYIFYLDRTRFQSCRSLNLVRILLEKYIHLVKFSIIMILVHITHIRPLNDRMNYS